MATEIKKGDKVRITIEGEVTYLYGDGDFDIDGEYAIGRHGTVEVLERAKKVYPLGTHYFSGTSTAVKASTGWIWLHTGSVSNVVDDDHVTSAVLNGWSTVREPQA